MSIFDTSNFSIQEIMTRHWKVRDQIDTIERLGTKLKYSVKDREQIHNLQLNFSYLCLDFGESLSIYRDSNKGILVFLPLLPLSILPRHHSLVISSRQIHEKKRTIPKFNIERNYWSSNMTTHNLNPMNLTSILVHTRRFKGKL